MMATFSMIFDHTTPGPEAARSLIALCQGKQQVAGYTWILSHSSWQWLQYSFSSWCLLQQPDSIKDQLVPLNRPSDLDSFIMLAIMTDNHLRESERDLPWSHISRGGNLLPIVLSSWQFTFSLTINSNLLLFLGVQTVHSNTVPLFETALSVSMSLGPVT